MADGKFPLFVLCRNTASSREWQTLAASYRDLDVKPVVAPSAIEKIRQLAASADAPFLVCADTVWIGLGMAAQMMLLIEELHERFPNWALCGNRGMRWDGQHLYDYSYDMDSGGLQVSTCAHPVISLDDGVLLVNPLVFNRHTKLAPPLKRLRPGVLLSLECLQNESVMAVSPRLLAMRASAADSDEVEQGLDSDSAFHEYYRSSFLNHNFSTPDGALYLSEIVDYQYVAEPWAETEQQDTLQLYDRSLELSRAGARPRLTICCRTQFLRAELLERAVLSFSAFRQHCAPLADVSVRLITDVPSESAAPAVERLQRSYPGAELECWHHDIRPNRYSRTDLLLAAIEHAGTDYIWFVDDDDYVNAAAAPVLGRSLVAGQPLVIVASTAKVRETWRAAPGGPGASASGLELTRAERGQSYEAVHVFRILRGLNFVPICGMVLPLGLMKERIARVRALGNYNEDYFLLLLALTAPRVDVCLLDCELSSVSIRGKENTVTQKDRSGWNISLATFLLEVINNSDGNSPFLWKIGNSPRW